MNVVGIVPVRMAASRFPGKPLAPILGLPMVEHVRRRAALCGALADVIVATCDDEIRAAVEAYGGRVVMTSSAHERCTDRIAEAALSVDCDVVVNVQGDEPAIAPDWLEALLEPFRRDGTVLCANLVAPVTDPDEADSAHVPKVVCSLDGDILYISRSRIPSGVRGSSPVLKQLGIIAFRSDFLQTFASLAPAPLEQIESVDMLRAIEHGFPVRAVVRDVHSVGVDVPGDVARAEALLMDDPLVARYA